MDEFEKARQKPAAWLDDDEKELIRKNTDKLTDEDKEAFSSFLTPDEGEGGSGDEGGQAGDPPARNEGGKADEGGDAGNGAGDPPKPPEEKPARVFQTQEDLDNYVKQKHEQDAKDKQAAIDAATTPEEKKYVEENWKPKSWNEPIKLIKDAVKQELKDEAKKEEDKKIEVAKRIEKEWQDLRKEHNLKDISDPEGRKIHDQIVDLGIKHGKKNFKDAYELWSMIPVEKGGGYKAADATSKPDPKDPPADDKGKEKINDAKKRAAQIGGNNPGGNKPNSNTIETPSYEALSKAKSARDLYKHLL